MAFVATDSTKEARSFSLGPIKVQVLTYVVQSGDTTASITADKLSRADHILMDGGLALTAAPSVSGNVVTLAFTDPAATRYGTILVLGI